MKIILIGIQGSGKSTQGELLQKKLQVPFLATGQIFRTMVKEDNPTAEYIKKIMYAGELIPDEKVLEIISDYLTRPEYKSGYIIDGFPRTVKQAEAFADTIDAVIYLNVSDKEALHRISLRNDQARKDETTEAIQRRIELFHQETEPVIEYYRGKNKLIEVDGEQTIEQIQQAITQKLSEVKHG
ncbi:MAG TPA: nucleoside monophosphate kinase [Patescibacteria group bacterium]